MTEENLTHEERRRAKLDALVGIKMPQHEAQTYHDHEEYARFYLGLLTDENYQKFLYGVTNSPFRTGAPSWIWSDVQLIAKARQHAEAARILKGLDDLHA